MTLSRPFGRLAYVSSAFALLAAAVAAQDPSADGAGNGFALPEWASGGMAVAVVAVVAVVIAAGLFVLLLGRRRHIDPLEESYAESVNLESSKFEQLLAETQGLYLRIQGGESKGYYRKIEQLARVFLERIGVSGARQMSYEQIEAVLAGGTLSQKISGTLGSVFERCRRGAEHETEKLDFSASELIKDLRLLIKQAAEDANTRAAS